MLGAATGLSSQYIVVNVTAIDAAKLKAALGGAKGGVAGLVLAIADETPKALLDIALPFAAKAIKDDYGIDATITKSNVEPTARGWSEFFPGVATGAATVAISWAIWRLGLRHLFGVTT